MRIHTKRVGSTYRFFIYLYFLVSSAYDMADFLLLNIRRVTLGKNRLMLSGQADLQDVVRPLKKNLSPSGEFSNAVPRYGNKRGSLVARSTDSKRLLSFL